MYHDLIFESAEHVFARKGFDDATMNEIAGEAGVSVKTLYATFPGKKELYEEIRQERMREFVASLLRSMDGARSPLDKLIRGIHGYLDYLVDHPDFMRIHLREGKAWALRPSGGVDEESWQLGVGAFAEVLREGMAEGLFYEGDAELMAMTGSAVMQVQLVRLAEGAASHADADAIAEDTVLHVKRLFCKPEAEALARHQVA
jgi:AcrR family transcriptional regulator